MDESEAEADFSAAFDRCAPLVLRFARRRLEDHDAAWDVVNETFTAAWRHWGKRPADAELLPWLYTIARNAICDERRSSARRSRLAARLLATGRTRYTADSADRVLLGRSVGEAFARLSPADREVLRLVAWEGLGDARSVGIALGLSAATARVRIHRARSRLRDLMAADGLDQPPDPAAPPRASSIPSHVSEA